MSDSPKYSSFKSQQIITESFRRYVNEVGYYGLGSEPFGAEKYRKKIEGLAKQLDATDYNDPRMEDLVKMTELAVSEILYNIAPSPVPGEDLTPAQELRLGVEEIVADVLGTRYLPHRDNKGNYK